MSNATPSADELRSRLLQIELPVTRIAKQTFVQMMRLTLLRRQGQIFVITGMPGTGKSHLKDQLVELAQDLCKDLKVKVPVLTVGLDTVFTLGDLARQIAIEIGNPVTMHRIMNKSAKELSTEVLEDIKRLGVKVIFFDEAHCISLSPDPSAPQSRLLASWLKKITNHGISIVFLGLPELGDKLTPYKELTSRMFRSQPLMTTGLLASTATERTETLEFLKKVQTAYGVETCISFSDSRIVIPMMGAMGGNLRDIMRLIDSAVGLSEVGNEKQVSLKSFEDAAELCGFPWKS